MLFNSYVFLLVFLPVVLLCWWAIRGERQRLLFLTLASYVFYGWWDWRFVPLMVASTSVDYIAGAHIAASAEHAKRKQWLMASLSFNLLVLGFFKYFGFFAASVDRVLEATGAPDLIPVFAIVLPVGISFYTFNSMSYTIDVYRRVVTPAKSLLHFSAFVAMFPHLVAGPIVRYSDLDQQLSTLKDRLSDSYRVLGAYFFVVGLAKKVLIADRLAPVATSFFGSTGDVGAIQAWIGVLAYTFQLYFDFSGYSEMAVGLAYLLGFQFPQNFNSPYKSVNISDFWRRWHISLSTWLRDYLFIPLGGSRQGKWRTARNLAITMILGGLWHGAAWTFIVWGLYHGVLLASHQLLRARGWTPGNRFVNQALTFGFVVIGWVFFRSPSIGVAGRILALMAGANGLGSSIAKDSVVLVAIAALIAFVAPNPWERRLVATPRLAIGLGAVMAACVLLLDRPAPFLYFQF
jgi:alginate O-acetyltransferase complex protein AlgI